MALRLLVADDNQYVADGLVLLLQREGFEAQAAYEGQQAVDVARSFHPDVLILDLFMPVVDGFQAAKRLRALPEFADKVFVALSGYEEQKHLDAAARARFDEYLVKPFKWDTLLSILSEVSREDRR